MHYYIQSKNGIVSTDREKPNLDQIGIFPLNLLQAQQLFIGHLETRDSIDWLGPKEAFVDGQEVREGEHFELFDTNKWWYAECGKCGWKGSSEKLAGGGQIADTGDYDDVLCPKCFSRDVNDADDSPESYVGTVALPIQEDKPKSCTKSCSPSDWKEGGKCDLNGCYVAGVQSSDLAPVASHSSGVGNTDEQISDLLHTILNSQREYIIGGIRMELVHVADIKRAFDEYFGVKEKEHYKNDKGNNRRGRQAAGAKESYTSMR